MSVSKKRETDALTVSILLKSLNTNSAFTTSGEVVKVDLALVHYPVCNKNDETIGSAITNLDLHDIARAGRTFGIDTFFVVTPYEDQQQIAREILDHWLTGYGARYNAKRKEALSIVDICDSLDALYERVTEKWQQRPTVLATCAGKQDNTSPYARVRQEIMAGKPHLLLFGTGWGLTPDVMSSVDATLPPIVGFGDYNHLSVRSAAAIICDRLLGDN